jgi:hypothetical protein
MSDDRTLVLLVLFVETLVVLGTCVAAAAAWSVTARRVRRARARWRMRRGQWPR